jgi:hypothetical protein
MPKTGCFVTSKSKPKPILQNQPRPHPAFSGQRQIAVHRLVEPNGFKAQVVTFDRKNCGLLNFSIAFRVAGGQTI